MVATLIAKFEKWVLMTAIIRWCLSWLSDCLLSGILDPSWDEFINLLPTSIRIKRTDRTQVRSKFDWSKISPLISSSSSIFTLTSVMWLVVSNEEKLIVALEGGFVKHAVNLWSTFYKKSSIISRLVWVTETISLIKNLYLTSWNHDCLFYASSGRLEWNKSSDHQLASYG